MAQPLTRRLRPAVGEPLVAWLVSRILVVGLAVLGWAVFGTPERGVAAEVPRPLSFLAAWDTTWYLDIASAGYERDLGQVGEAFSNLAFFPLLPALMALASGVGLNPAIAAIVISNLAFLGALLALWKLTAAVRGEATATVATWCLALAPPAVVASMAYTEGLVLAAAVGAALAAVRGRWLLAGALAAVAALARPPGAAVAVLLLALAVTDLSPGRAGRLARVLLPTVAALGAFAIWMWAARGSPLLPIEAQSAWDRGTLLLGLVTVMPGEVADAAVAVVHLDVTAAWWATLRDVGFGALYLALLAALRRQEGSWRSPWVVYSALVLALPLASGAVTSLARLGLMAFPLAWPAADWIRAREPTRARIAASAAIIGIVAFTALLAIRSP